MAPVPRTRLWTRRVFGLMAAMVTALQSPFSTACTVIRFDAGGNLIVARNHDWPFGEGMLVVNSRGIEKKGLSPVNPASWVSKYGSVSFAQFGREIPFAGMNERGLTIDLLQLIEAQFPPPGPEIATVNVVQWVQYQLDTAATVDDVIASLAQVLPAPMLPAVERVHYFVTDAGGDVAVIEFLGGKPVVQHGTDVKQCALANSTWMNSSRSLGFAPEVQLGERRYIQAVQAVESLPPDSEITASVDFAFETLDVVSQRGLTQWQIVYQPLERRIDFKTTQAPTRRWIDLDDLAFDADEPTLVIDVDTNNSGNLAEHLVVCDQQANQRIVDNAFDRFMQPGFARVAIKQLVLDYPGSLKVARIESVTAAAP